jgi:hypothetical protein
MLTGLHGVACAIDFVKPFCWMLQGCGSRGLMETDMYMLYIFVFLYEYFFLYLMTCTSFYQGNKSDFVTLFTA